MTDYLKSEYDRPKQVIIIRQKYPDNKNPDLTRKLRTGKLIAQACHASQLSLKNAQVMDTDACRDWLNTRITKVCVYVDTAEELLELYAKAKASDLPCALIQDSGLTEFNYQPTYTALGIGPAYDSELKQITGHLPLF